LDRRKQVFGSVYNIDIGFSSWLFIIRWDSVFKLYCIGVLVIGSFVEFIPTKKEEPMATTDTCCTIVPYFKVHEGKLDDFKALCTQFVEKTNSEPKCLYYGWSFDGEQAHCREGYADAEGLLVHLENVGALLQEALKIADITRLEVHGPDAELAKLREPMADLNPQLFTLECGFRK
jgi:quinol monooxygenase YgiN